MVDSAKLMEISSYLSIIHHIKGRIRVRVNPNIKKQKDNITIKDIEKIVKKINGINNIRINKIVGSVTIEYNNQIFPNHLWEDMIEGRNLDEIAGIINVLSKEVM